MKDEIVGFILGVKAGIGTAAISTTATWGASLVGWLDSYIAQLTAIASFLLLITMLIGHWCALIRKNRESKQESIERDLRIQMLKRQLKEVKDELDP